MAALRRLGPADLGLMRAMLRMFADAFEDPDSYAANPPGDAWLERLLGRDHFIALAALDGEAVVGGLCAYVLEKFEQERAEIYIYDLAVAAAHRRQGIATALVGELARVAADAGAWVVYVQADLEDAPAIALYESLGVREEVLHFDIPVRKRGGPRNP